MKTILRLLIPAATAVLVLLVLDVAPSRSQGNPFEPRANLGVPRRPAPDFPVPGVGEAGGPSRVLTPAELAQWVRGRAIFDRDFHKSTGLGSPGFNADSCRACHRDPVIGGAGPLELNVSRFGSDNGGAGPFADLPGGQGLSKLFPPYTPGREEYDPMTADVFEQRQTPTLFGGGLIDSISDATILANADPTDADMDGISGVARLIDTGAMAMEVGRFGWKAQLPRLEDFTRDALKNECGITAPDDGRGFTLLSDGDAAPDPEFSAAEMTDLMFFLQNLAPPARGGSTSPTIAVGEGLFTTIGCAKCHIPSLMGSGGPVPLFSDLLVHDVMSPGFRGMAEMPDAPAGTYRTAPLWGLRATAPYMHDGRAETIADAIDEHDGEAAASRVLFQGLSAGDRQALLDFLRDL